MAVAAAPTVSISTTKTAESTGPFTATFTFSEAVTGFVVTDLTVTNGTASGFSGTGTTYTATITPDNDDVMVTLTVPAGAATDAAGDANTAATARPYPPARLQQAYVDQGQGLFIHFGLESFLGRTTAHNRNTPISVPVNGPERLHRLIFSIRAGSTPISGPMRPLKRACALAS